MGKSMTKRSIAWATWSLATLFYAYQYVIRVAPNVLIDDIKVKYLINDEVFGQFLGVYYLGYALIHIPLGLMLDRYGPKRIMPLFLGLTILGMAPLAFSDFWIYPLVGRFLVGIGSTAAILGLFKIIRMAFDKDMFTWMLSISVPVGLLGAIYGGVPLNRLHQWLGLENITLLMMGVGVILAILIYIVTPKLAHQSGEATAWSEVKAVLGNRYVLVVCLLAGFMVGPLEGFADGWASTFLRSAYGMSKDAASGFPSWIFIGMMFGGVILSFIAKKVQSDLGVIFGCALLMMLAFVGLIFGFFATWTFSAVFFLIGILCAYQIIAIAHVSTKVPAQFSGLTSSLANMVIMTFGYVFHALVGFAVHLYAGDAEPGALVSTTAINSGVSVIAFGLAISAVGFFILMLLRRRYRC